MSIEQLRQLIESGQFHHATYRQIGTIWEGLYIYAIDPDPKWVGYRLVGSFNKSGGMEGLTLQSEGTMVSTVHNTHVKSNVSWNDCQECRADTERRFVRVQPWREYKYVADYLAYIKPLLAALDGSVEATVWYREFLKALHRRISLRMPAQGRKQCDSYSERLRQFVNRREPSGQDVKHGGNMISTKAKMEFAFTIGRHVPLMSMHDVQRILRYGATLKAIAERQCNGYSIVVSAQYGLKQPANGYDAIAADSDEFKQRRFESKIRSICLDADCNVVFQGDPRGNVVKIVAPDGYTNDWGKEGICVPTS